MSLPAHGPIPCRKCWPIESSAKVFTTADRRFNVVNDPGAWGSSNPEILVLGISKGFTQALEFEAGEFDAVPFKNCRERLKLVLVAVGLLPRDAAIDELMLASEEAYAWGSVVRCSVSGWNAKKGAYTAATPDVLPAFKHTEAGRFLRGCMRRFMAELPERTRTVVLLGNDDRYIETIGAELREMYSRQYSRLNEVAHSSGSTVWVHVAHPSRGNGHHGEFVDGDAVTSKQGRKRESAKEALRRARVA